MQIVYDGRQIKTMKKLDKDLCKNRKSTSQQLITLNDCSQTITVLLEGRGNYWETLLFFNSTHKKVEF